MTLAAHSWPLPSISANAQCGFNIAAIITALPANPLLAKDFTVIIADQPILYHSFSEQEKFVADAIAEKQKKEKAAAPGVGTKF